MQNASRLSMRHASCRALSILPMRKKPDAERVYEPRPRLIAARARRYATADEAATAMGVSASTYRGHENGARGLGRAGARYAKFFNVSLDWLINGKGTMSGAPAIPVMGRIGAGALVASADDAAEIALGDTVEMPTSSEAEAYVVQGDSMRPRFFSGEVLIFDKNALLPARLVGQYCKVQVENAEAPIYVKLLRPGRTIGRWRLESHNADTIEDVELRAAWQWLGLLPPRAGSK